MKPLFCTTAAQQLGEDLLGTAGHYQAYVLIECSLPWAAKVFNSEGFPPALRQFIEAIKAKRSVQFLCINRGQSATPTHTTVLLYERTQPTANSFSNGYKGYEFQLNSLDQVIDCLQTYWQTARSAKPITGIQDILICTHGQRDKCCARFGQPFFRAAQHLRNLGKLPNTRLWRVSHIGGHRFAPTAIAFPDGRYYGRLSANALQSIVNRTGDISQIRSVYRGWGILPLPLQVLERQLMLSHGWDWFDYRVSYQLLTAPTSSGLVKATLTVEQPSGTETFHPEERSEKTYHATLMRDPNQAHCLRASCSAARPSVFVKYAVADCKLGQKVEQQSSLISQ
ncbi:MAG: sucrase ferredoxin [Phormidesmis sp.]